MKKLYILLLGLITLEVNAENISQREVEKYWYIGAEAGISDPVVKSFTHKESNTVIRLKKSHIYSGIIGYSFYPGMMIEISGTYQPKYRMAYTLPKQSLSSLVQGLSIPETYGITPVSTNVFMVNFIYEMMAITSMAIKPYVIGGAGIAKIATKPNVSYWQAPAFLKMGTNVPYFKIKKNSQNCFAWQVGVGINKDVTNNFSVNLSAKMQVVKDIKIKYQTLNVKTNSFDEAQPIKKTIGVGEFAIGLTYKLPL